MPVNLNPIAVVDFETCNLIKDEYSPIQLACLVLDPRSLEPIEGGEFSSLMKPLDFSKIQDKALEVNKITREELMEAPPQKEVWELYVKFLGQFNRKNTVYTAPIMAGYNIRNFDYHIFQALARKYGNVDKENNQKIFNQLHMIEMLDILHFFTESLPDLEKLKLDVVRSYFGLTHEGAHTAIGDVKITAKLLKRFLMWVRELSRKANFKGSFANV